MAAQGKHSLMCVAICTLVMLAYANGEWGNGEDERIRNVKDMANPEEGSGPDARGFRTADVI